MQHRTKIAALRRVVLVAGLCCLVLGAAAAQEYPSRTVKMIVPYPAGGITDVLPRTLQEQLTRKWGQPIVVENKTGGNQTIAYTYDFAYLPLKRAEQDPEAVDVEATAERPPVRQLPGVTWRPDL